MSDKRISQFTEKTTFGGNDYLVTDNASEATSKKVKATLISDQLSDMQNVYGSKNLASYPYDLTTRNSNGVTFTDNGDGTITADGTATEDTYFAMRTRNTNTGLSLKAGTYILSGCPEGGAMNKYQLYIINADNTETIARDIGEGYEFTLANDVEKYGLLIRVTSGQAVSNLVFKPMIRLASIKDDSWVPYAATNEDLTKRTNPINNMINDLGAKNLLIYPYYNTTKTDAGVTFTDNGDGTIKANGTSTTGNSHFTLTGSALTKSFLKASTTYKVSLGFNTGSSSTYFARLYLVNTSDTIYDTIYCYTGEDVTFTTGSAHAYVNMELLVMSGTTVSNLVFKPMIRYASIEDDTWEPYAKTNQELTKDAKAIKPIINILGAKNLLKCTNSSYTINGLTFTLNSNGSIKVKGTATATTYYRIDDVQASSGYYLQSGKRYILSGCPTGGSEAGYRLYIESNGLTIDDSVDYGNGATFTAPTFNNRWSTIIRVMSGTVFGSSGKTFYPMIRPLGVEDDTFVPYAETNAQLTADVASINSALSHVGMIIQSTTLDTEAKVKAIYGTNTSWIQHSGYVLRGGTSDVVANSAVKTGGNDNAVVVSHSHSATAGSFVLAGTSGSNVIGQTGTLYGGAGLNTKTAAEGESGTNKNIPNYKSVYIWERTA